MKRFFDSYRQLLRILQESRPRYRSRPVHERQLRDAASRASSWMAPWERAQMDAPRRPLALWEKIYWRLFVVFGGVGLVYETYVLQNRTLLPRVTKQRIDRRTMDGEVDGASPAIRSSSASTPVLRDSGLGDVLDWSVPVVTEEGHVHMREHGPSATYRHLSTKDQQCSVRSEGSIS